MLAALAAASLIYGAIGVLDDAEREGSLLWDLRFYRAAAARWHAGEDPFLDDGAQVGYYYSISVTPLHARVFHRFEAEGVYLLVMVLAISATIWLSISAARAPPEIVLPCALYALAFGGAEALYTLGAGNLAWLVSLLAAVALWGASRGRWPLFYVLIGLASLLKPYTLALLLVPWVLRSVSPLIVLALVPIVVDGALGRALRPEWVASRTEAIWLGIIEPLQLRYTVAGRLSRLLHDLGLDVGAATALAVGVQLAICAAIALLVRRRLRGPDVQPPAFALATVTAFTAVIRMAGYDAYLFAPATFVAFWYALESSPSRPARAAVTAILALGVFKEGLVYLPLLILLWLLISRAPLTAKRGAS